MFPISLCNEVMPDKELNQFIVFDRTALAEGCLPGLQMWCYLTYDNIVTARTEDHYIRNLESAVLGD